MPAFDTPFNASHLPGDHHLATLLSAYVDAQLSPADMDRVEGHLVTCAECAQAVEEIREVRGILAAPPIISPSDSLLAQLSLIEEAQALSEPECDAGGQRRWPTRMLVAAFGLAASMALLTLLGTYDLPDVSGNVAQRAQNSLLNHKLHQPRFAALPTGFEQAGSLEPELRSLAARTANLEVLAVNADSERDEVEAIMIIDAAQIVMRDRRGKLPAGEHAVGQIAEVAGHEVQLVSQAPWTAVWQRGDRVISVSADAPHDTIALLIESFPPVPVDEGLGARMLRGVHKVGQVIG